MTSPTFTPAADPEIVYPSGDGEPVAETEIHFLVILSLVAALKQHLHGQEAAVLGNLFFYYSQGFPRLRVAPDVMVVFGISSGDRDNYKLWEEGQIPSIIFEITSEGTRSKDQGFKKDLYEQLGVQEYWLFDPRGEWIAGQLRGYTLQNDVYCTIEDSISQVLGLRLAIEGKMLCLYRLDTGEKLLIPDELFAALQAESQRRLEAEQQLAEERQRAETLMQQLAAYRERFGDLNGDV